MTTAQSNHYSQLRTEYLSKARIHLAEDDLKQASEKAWGAAATAVKAIGESRGLEHGRHGDLWRTLRLVVRETGDREIRVAFGLAESLHTNFYEAWLGREDVELCFSHVERLSGKLSDRDHTILQPPFPRW